MSNKYFQTPFASNGDKAAINDLVQSDGTVSYQEGYGEDYAKNPIESGAKFIDRSQMNGLFNEITGYLKEWQEQGYYTYNPAIKYDIGGRCNYNDGTGLKAYISTQSNNTRVPSINGAVQSGWILDGIQRATLAEAKAGTGNNLMTPGLVKAAMDQFGLFGKPVEIPLNVNGVRNDINNYRNSGIYYSSYDNATLIKNSPFKMYFHLMVFACHSIFDSNKLQSRVIQVAYNQNREYLSGATRFIWKETDGDLNYGNWQSMGNKGINTSAAYTTLSWNVNYTAPVNGTIYGRGGVSNISEYMVVAINDMHVLDVNTSIIAGIPSISYPVRSGQKCRIFGTLTGTAIYPRTVRFYPD